MWACAGLCLGLIMHGCKGAGSLGKEEERKGREGKIDKSVKEKSAVVEEKVRKKRRKLKNGWNEGESWTRGAEEVGRGNWEGNKKEGERESKRKDGGGRGEAWQAVQRDVPLETENSPAPD